MDKVLDVDRELLECVAEELTFGGMVRILHRLWVRDLDSVFDVIDTDTLESTILLRTGVWQENKLVFDILHNNRQWWSKYFVEKRPDGVFVFRSTL
jgi:hypothetical protein